MKKRLIVLSISTLFSACKTDHPPLKPSVDVVNSSYYKEEFRPQYHFSPKTSWMYDPNGLVYNNGTYHLFYQYFPDDIVWGPMHWGHAISKDLVNWEHKKIALYPDDMGYIFSGSAILDKNNSSGLGTEENPPLIAVFTYHDPNKEKKGDVDFQFQGLAYRIDNGDTWNKFEDNPIIPNTTGIRDFRDPKLFWNDQINQWTIALVVKDHVQLWKSSNLKDWSHMSSFGKELGSHGGVWECPDLFEMKVEGSDETKWVSLVSINPGAPNGGSGTQYFVGDFDGVDFTTDQKTSKWIDGGTDNYAGVTYNDTPHGERIFIGWMSNWSYAPDIPTSTWRSSMTVARVLKLKIVNGEFVLFSSPVDAFDKLIEESNTMNFELGALEEKLIPFTNIETAEIKFSATDDFSLRFENDKGELLKCTFLTSKNEVIIDRSKSGMVDFNPNFFPLIKSPIDFNMQSYSVRILLDKSSMEIFINDGQGVVTTRHFNTQPFSGIRIINEAQHSTHLEGFQLSPIKSIWI